MANSGHEQESMMDSCRNAFFQFYLRLSVTRGCNLRCLYCRPAEAAGPIDRGGAADEELVSLVGQIHRAAPIYKVRVTGGEPLVRPGLAELIRQIRLRVPKARLALTTNGLHLERMAGPLRQAGVSALNVSLDSASPTSYRQITRGGSLAQALRGIAAAREVGFALIRLNAVLLRQQNGTELSALVRLAADLEAEIRFIELMPYGQGAALYQQEFLSADEALACLCRTFRCHGSAEASATARRFRFDVAGREVMVGMITPVSHPFCGACDRIRLDSRGHLRGCMRSDTGVDLLDPWRAKNAAEVQRRIATEVCNKSIPSGVWPSRDLVTIGG